ncbi:MAG: FAD:protein FMN transferase [Deinococcales bacterium]
MMSVWQKLQQLWPHLGAKATSYQQMSYEQVLGTSCDLAILATQEKAQAACEAALAEIDRLEKVYSRFDETSELNCWLVDDSLRLSHDLSWLLNEAERWQNLSQGAFNPAVDALSRLWQKAAQANTLPNENDLEATLALLSQKLYQLDAQGHYAQKLSPLGLNFNAMAKGRIVDEAAFAAYQLEGVESLLINIGGDLRHMGRQGILVDVADAFSKLDNAKPLLRLKIQNQAVATSGQSRRGYHIKGQWYSHVIDPQTGQSVKDHLSVTVIAPDCATADVLATSFSVLKPQASLALADSLPDVGCLICSYDKLYSNDFFDRHIWQDSQKNAA